MLDILLITVVGLVIFSPLVLVVIKWLSQEARKRS